ncbi:MAG: hypothetical protein AB8B58_03705, partial [Roseobacter sp.]
TAEAEVSLAGATIGGQLDCTDARFNAKSGYALNAQRLTVKRSFFFQNVKTPRGVIDLTAAHVSDLVDDPVSWPPNGRLRLEGFTYDRVYNFHFAYLRGRLDWLAKGDTWRGEFYPHPYTQLAKVYREMGHDADAREILLEREKRLLAHRLYDTWDLYAPDGKDKVTLRRFNLHVFLWSYLARWVVGYGYKPFRSVLILLALIAISAVFAARGWDTGGFAPNSAHVLVSADWTVITAREDAAAQVWIGERLPKGWDADGDAPAWETIAPGRDWETFNALAYGADIAIPIIEFGQTDAWAPSTSRGAWGTFLWWWRWVATIVGWVVTGLGAAAVTGIIRRD